MDEKNEEKIASEAKRKKTRSFTNNSLQNTKKVNYLIFSPFPLSLMLRRGKEKKHEIPLLKQLQREAFFDDKKVGKNDIPRQRIFP